MKQYFWFARSCLSMCPSISHLLSKLVCHARELLQQFIMDDPLGNGKGVYNVIMHPYTLHSLAKGHSLKYFEPYLNLSSLKVCYILLLCNALGLLFFFPSLQLACKWPVRRRIHSGKDGLFLGATTPTTCPTSVSMGETASSTSRC